MEGIKNKILNHLVSIDDVVRDGRTCLARPNFWTQAGTGRKKNIFPVQLTTSRVGYIIRLVHTLLFVQIIHIRRFHRYFCRFMGNVLEYRQYAENSIYF